ncbi:Leucyl-tRNA synthetase [hydrothermal vent metagenome]|uniref:leucine--tRNA ligase n=1 Tax=hydrothermal vent metagenome TaxID=652676 RepID=A0A3B0Z1M5_9ZZZZ
MLGQQSSILDAAWPQADAAALVRDTIELVVQVNGKVRGKVEMVADAAKDIIEQTALADENVQRFIEWMDVAKVIVVPGRLVNVVVEEMPMKRLLAKLESDWRRDPSFSGVKADVKALDWSQAPYADMERKCDCGRDLIADPTDGMRCFAKTNDYYRATRSCRAHGSNGFIRIYVSTGLDIVSTELDIATNSPSIKKEPDLPEAYPQGTPDISP